MGTRIARADNGKTYHIPADMSYEDWKAIYVDKSQSFGIRKSRLTKTRARTVAWYFQNENLAIDYYRNVRKNNNDIHVISKNTNFSKRFITEVKQRIFYDKHNIDGDLRKFDADYNIAIAWQRMLNNQIES